MKYRLIGDVHGRFRHYSEILNNSPHPTIQVGDLGVGFLNTETNVERPTPVQEMISGDHRFIRGNHDNPDACRRHPTWIRDGHQETLARDNRVMYVGGAFSIDRAYRTEGLDWWRGEELDNTECDKIIESYIKFKPGVMITHDAPESAAFDMFLAGTSKPVIRTKTGQLLQTLFEIHRPNVWIFGHWHITRHYSLSGTEFLCLGELATFDLDM